MLWVIYHPRNLHFVIVKPFISRCLKPAVRTKPLELSLLMFIEFPLLCKLGNTQARLSCLNAIGCNSDKTSKRNSVKSTSTSAGNCTSQDHK